jgi:hypothetical protein
MNKCYDVRGVCPKDQLYGNSVTFIKGEAEGIRLIDATQDDGTRIWPDSTDSGRRVASETMPGFLKRVGPQDYPLLDFYSMAQNLVVPERARQVIEELEPGVHQFFKMQIVEEHDKSRTPIGERYFVVVCNRLATLHDTLCEPPLENGWPVGFLKKHVFSRQKIGQAHLWIDKRAPGAGPAGCLISEELQERLAAPHMSGIQFTAFQVAD